MGPTSAYRYAVPPNSFMVHALSCPSEVSLEASGEAPEVPLTEYVNAKQQYRLLVPAGWDVKGKAGEQPACVNDTVVHGLCVS